MLELLENIAVDQEAIAARRDLQTTGYSLALDDFVPGSDAEQLVPYVKFVKVDVLAIPPALARDVASRLRPLAVRLVAEKVETVESFKASRDAGYTLSRATTSAVP